MYYMLKVSIIQNDEGFKNVSDSYKLKYFYGLNVNQSSVLVQEIFVKKNLVINSDHLIKQE